jgi:hypothetical protein
MPMQITTITAILASLLYMIKVFFGILYYSLNIIGEIYTIIINGKKHNDNILKEELLCRRTSSFVMSKITSLELHP